MRRAAILVLLAGCGPAVSVGTESSSSSSTGETPGSTTRAPDPATTGTPPPNTTGTPPSTTTGTIPEPSTEGGTDGSSSASSEDGGFITPTGGGCGFGGECSVRDQDCCEGEACKAWANDGTDIWNASKCTPVAPNAGQAGEPCTAEGSAVSGSDTCDVGLMCWNVDPDTLEGTCAQFCGTEEGDPTCATPAEVCNISNEYSLPLCLPACDPLAQDCADGFGCYPSSEAEFVCIREGDRVLTDGVFHPDCPAGTFGVPPDLLEGCGKDGPCCTSFCDQTAASACAEGECLPYFEPPMDGLPVGYCSVPI